MYFQALRSLSDTCTDLSVTGRYSVTSGRAHVTEKCQCKHKFGYSDMFARSRECHCKRLHLWYFLKLKLDGFRGERLMKLWKHHQPPLQESNSIMIPSHLKFNKGVTHCSLEINLFNIRARQQRSYFDMKASVGGRSFPYSLV